MSEHIVLVQVIREDSATVSEIVSEYEIGRFPGTDKGLESAEAAAELLLAECGYEEGSGEDEEETETDL